MRKLIAVGVLVGGLLAGAGSATAQTGPPLLFQGGIGDPLTLPASGVLLPFITAGGTIAIIEAASPVGKNTNLHLIFYNETCVKGDSLPLPETTNDIAFVIPTPFPVAGGNGLVAIAQVDPTFQHLIPLESPVHTRVYEFSTINGRSRVLEPIIIDTYEFGLAAFGPGFEEKLWSPLRTAATFYAPLETAVVATELTLICPRTTIQGGTGAAFGSGVGTTNGFSNTGFPLIVPPFKAAPSTASTLDDMDGVVYDTDEHPLTNIHFTCDCLSADVSVNTISAVYALAAVASKGTYTEIFVHDTLGVGPQLGSFTGYKASFTVGSGINNFFGRLSNGSRPSINGAGPAAGSTR